MDTPAQSPPFFHLAEILVFELPAWHVSDRGAFYYDGITLWREHNGRLASAEGEEAPNKGWWHRADCACIACTAYRDDRQHSSTRMQAGEPATGGGPGGVGAKPAATS